jgi:hypothetical protein
LTIGDAVLARQAAAWPHLRFVSVRDGHEETARDEPDVAGLQGDRLSERGRQVKPGGVLGHARGQSDILHPRRALDQYPYRTAQTAFSSER